MTYQPDQVDYGQPRRGNFDTKLVQDCAKAFASATGLGTIVSSADGSVVSEYGHGCASCHICELAGRPKSLCLKTYINGMREAERFGGKYIYFCAMGLTCFSSPIVVEETNEAEITVGPFLMVDRDDYETCELVDKYQLADDCRQKVVKALDNIPYIQPRKVNDLSTLLFMSISFMNNIGAANDMLDAQMSLAIQTQISSSIYRLKGVDGPTSYPFDVEEKLLAAVAKGERDTVENYLNELFGYIFFASGHVFSVAKSRVAELLVLISRTAVHNGADPEKCLMLTHDYLLTLPNIQTWEILCSCWFALPILLLIFLPITILSMLMLSIRLLYTSGSIMQRRSLLMMSPKWSIYLRRILAVFLKKRWELPLIVFSMKLGLRKASHY